MKTLHSHISTIPEELIILQKTLLGSIKKTQDFFILTIDHKIGTGSVRYHHLQTGLKILDFDLHLKADLEIPVDLITSETLQFLFCLDGAFFHQFEDDSLITPIEQFQTAVAHSDEGILSRIFVKKEKRLIINVILVNKKEYFDKFSNNVNHFDKKLQDLLTDIGQQPKHFHAGKYSLKIAEQLKLLIGIEHTNEIAELLSQKGRYYLILAKHIEQFCAEVDDNVNTSGLLKAELKSVSEASDFIKNQPEIQHSIKSLCRQSGLSPAKLQEGFKFMFDRTVSDFVRNVRLEKAELLIRTTDLTISEIVYTVGLTSRSYFCKVFKQKYKLSPKEYKKQVPQVTTSNLV